MKVKYILNYRLALCEKALAEYLETKRLAFPRFYFVSAADLLDILSKGNQPIEVSRLIPYHSYNSGLHCDKDVP